MDDQPSAGLIVTVLVITQVVLWLLMFLILSVKNWWQG